MASFHQSLRYALREHGITEVMLREIETTVPAQELSNISWKLQSHMIPDKNGLTLGNSEETKQLVAEVAGQLLSALEGSKSPKEPIEIKVGDSTEIIELNQAHQEDKSALLSAQVQFLNGQKHKSPVEEKPAIED